MALTDIHHTISVHCCSSRQNYVGSKFEPNVNNISVQSILPVSNVKYSFNQRDSNTINIPVVSNQRVLHIIVQNLISLLHLITSWMVYMHVHRMVTTQGMKYMQQVWTVFVAFYTPQYPFVSWYDEYLLFSTNTY